jgi:hypothetical protein
MVASALRLRALLELLEDPKMNQQVMCLRTDFALKAGGFGRLGCAVFFRCHRVAAAERLRPSMRPDG